MKKHLVPFLAISASFIFVATMDHPDTAVTGWFIGIFTGLSSAVLFLRLVMYNE